MCPLGGRLMDGVSDGAVGHLVCHCLLIETEAGLVLVDTGLGMQDVANPFPRLSPFYVNLLRVQLRESETAVRQVERLGFSANDVRHIVLTHLDFDHAGGLEDFPSARVHVLRRERDSAALGRRGFVARRRYRPQQWDAVDRWNTYAAPAGERWFGFECVRQLDGLPPEILLVPLAGHTWGHSGVAIESERDWLLHAGDAYFHYDEMRAPELRCPPGLAAYQRLMEVDRYRRLENQHRLRALARQPDAHVSIVCSHDATEFEACVHTAASTDQPAFA